MGIHKVLQWNRAWPSALNPKRLIAATTGSSFLTAYTLRCNDSSSDLSFVRSNTVISTRPSVDF